MTSPNSLEPASPRTLARLLDGFSIEITSHDTKGLDVAASSLDPGREVFVACLPNDDPRKLINACSRLFEAGLTPVPHIVARNQPSREALAALACRLADVGTRRALVIAGDRQTPVGPFSSSIEVIREGALANAGFTHTFFGVHPEGHPRVDDRVLWAALREKAAEAEGQGQTIELVGQFGFEPGSSLAFAEQLDQRGFAYPFRIGVAGPASRASLVKFALVCGIGTSLRALRERQDMAKNVALGETPEKLLRAVAEGLATGQAANLQKVHFFTFGGIGKSLAFISSLRAGNGG